MEVIQKYHQNKYIPIKIKKFKIQDISEIIALSGVKLSGLSYWSLTDKTDCNLERIRTELQKWER